MAALCNVNDSLIKSLSRYVDASSDENMPNVYCGIAYPTGGRGIMPKVAIVYLLAPFALLPERQITSFWRCVHVL